MIKHETTPSVIKLIETLSAIQAIYTYAATVISESAITNALSEIASKKQLQLVELSHVFTIHEDKHKFPTNYNNSHESVPDFESIMLGNTESLILKCCIEKEIELGHDYHALIEIMENPVGKFMLKNHRQDNASLIKQLYQLSQRLPVSTLN